MSIFNGRAEDIQFKLVAGDGIVISGEHDEIIRSTGGGGIAKYDVLPETAPENTIAYLNGVGFYRYTTEWVRITKDSLESEVGVIDSDVTQLKLDSHTHSNKDTLDGITSAKILEYDDAASKRHTHENKSAIDTITSAKLGDYDDAVAKKHTHENKATLDGITASQLNGYDDAVAKKHTHENKDVLDNVTSAVIQDTHNHANKSTLDKLTETSGKLLFDGSEVGGGVPKVQHPSDLQQDAQDGSVAVAVNDDEGIVYPEQISDEEVTVDVAGKQIYVGSPSFNSSAIGTAITAQDLPTATVEVSGEGNLSAVIVPVVADINNNDYTNAGMTLDPSQVVIATCTKNYSIGLMLVPNLVKPDKIIPVDADHVKLPFMAILAYENLSGSVYGLPNESLTEGWNIALATVDTATYSDITGIEIVTGIDINEYVSLEISDNNEMTIEGISGVELFRNIIIGNDGGSKGMYVKLGRWKRALLDDPIVDDVTLLGFTTYENLVIRDDVLPDSIQDVPVFACGDIDLGGRLISIADANENYIALCDIDDADGLPVRYIKTNFNGTVKVWFPVATSPVSSAISYPQGWSEGGVSTTAPSFEGFTPTHIDYKNTYYTDVSTLPAKVKSALRSLSQCINVSKESMGSISVPEDSVARFNGTIEPNRKYYFNTGRDFAIDLPTVPFAEEDAQFAIYLKTGSVVDMTLPSDVLVSGEIDTSEGNHKVIGCYDKTVNKWCIGCVDYEVAE